MARTLSNWEYRCLTSECQHLVGKHLDKVFEIRPDLFRLDFSTNESLMLDLGKCFYLTRDPPGAPMNPTAMAMTIRKHAGGKRLASFEQYKSDRIYIITLGSGHRLLMEQFVNGNLFLLDENNKIIRPYHFKPDSKHTFMVGGKYEYPPSASFNFPPGLEDWNEQAKDKAAATLPIFLSKWPIGKRYTDELLARLGMNGKKVGEVGEAEAEKLLQELGMMLADLQPRVYEKISQAEDKQEVFELSLIPLAEYENPASGFSARPFPTFSQAVEYFFAHYKEEAKDAEPPQLKGLRHRLKKQEAALQKLDEEIGEKAAETQQLETYLVPLEARRLELLAGAKPREGVEEIDKDKKKWKIRIKEEK